ncbi:hypothetical protein [Rugamonas apoptosis]|uniref:Uncharacterized protein n=1 Tax=Rugamonas apoptosis TaxID=2758570 RepID=A0A7W2FE65_9BURK|nr:hypothetical protein [Rugamonas apoptosis]MBA5690036.1 hypothetical protein [Rugamonas apoptosis]
MTVYEKLVRLPAEVLEELGDHSGHWWSDPALEAIIVEAIHAFIKPASAKRQQQPAPDTAGYQWKQLFLPAGTRLRASFGGKPSFAVVVEDGIQCDGQAVSPSGFANRQGSGNRNAWKVIWLRFPGSEQWLLADVCRVQQSAAIARLFGGEAQTANLATPPHPVPASRAKRARDPQPKPKKKAARPPGVAAIAHTDGDQRKHGAGRGARRKRRAQKHVPGNP